MSHETHQQSNRSRHLALPLVSLILLIPGLFIYAQAFTHGFVGVDDSGQVPQDPAHYGFSLQQLITLFSTSTVHMYQPLTSLCLHLVVALFGFEQAGPFHVFSFCLHLINGAMVYLLGSKLFKSPHMGLLLALLFISHPLAVESVAWVSATSTLLFSFFFLLALYAQIQYREQKGSHWFAISLVAFMLGGLSKVLILPFVGVLFLLDHLYQEPIFSKASLRRKAPFILLAVCFGGIALHFRGGQTGFPNYDYNPLLLAPCQMAWYVFKLVVPTKLVTVYDWPHELGGFGFVASYLFVGGAGLALFRLRQNRLFVFGVLFYAGNIILHTTLFSQYLGPYADRYAYLSTLGVWLALFALLGERVLTGRRFPALALIMILTLFAREQTAVWKDSISLWTQNIQHESGSFAYGMRGAEYFKAENYDAAIQDFLFVHDNPDSRFEPEKYAFMYTSLANLTRKTDKKQALIYFKKATDYTTDPGARMNLARSYLEVGETKNAEQVLLRIAKQKPNHIPSHDLLVMLYVQTRDYAKALPLLDQMIQGDNQNIMHYKKRAFIRLQMGDRDQATVDVKKALALTKKENRMPQSDPQLMQLAQETGVLPQSPNGPQ